jgi:hypothetical protein
MKGREDIEFKTVDGLTLRGWFFPAAQRGPAIIVTPGVVVTIAERALQTLTGNIV